MERIYVFLPSVLVLVCIAGAMRLYLKWVINRFGDNFKSVEWHKRNQWKVGWTVGLPSILVWAPAEEELIFRAPLIIACSTLSSVAWYGVFISSVLFALMHWFGEKIWMPEILSELDKDDHKTDDVAAEVNRLHQKKGKWIVVRKVLHVISSLPVGVLAGYYGIKYQSIWVSVCIHSAWNLIMPLVLQLIPLLMLSGVYIFLSISSLWDKVWWWRRRSE